VNKQLAEGRVAFVVRRLGQDHLATRRDHQPPHLIAVVDDGHVADLDIIRRRNHDFDT
jgi:hypothetical protein